ncbi:DUF1738 domain-containing protein [Acidithiobacillus sp. MC6.1]|nr:DUF1738 domain-containing protein [Acidithiobacillus sp. MC6.1]
MATSKNEMLDALLARVDAALEKGEKLPWQKPWEPIYGDKSAPHNPLSDRPYSPANALLLLSAAMEKGYDDPRWVGYQQAKKEGWQVRQGEKASHVYSPVIKTEIDDKTGKEETRAVAYRATAIFNAAQIDGIPPLAIVPESERKPKTAELDAIAGQMGVGISHGGDSAFYSPHHDRIQMPSRDNFLDQHGYDATKAHELSHATGHESRLNRDSLKQYTSIKGRAAEEMTAEIGSYLLSTRLGVPFMGNNPDMTDDQHAAYLATWGKDLTPDERRAAVANGIKAVTELEKQLELARENGLVLGQDQAIEQGQDHTLPEAKAALDLPRHTTLVLTPRTDLPPRTSDGERYVPVNMASGRIEQVEHKARELTMTTLDGEKVAVLVPDGLSFCNFSESGDHEKDLDKFFGLKGKDVDIRMPNEKGLIVFDRATGDDLYSGISDRARTPYYLMESARVGQDGKTFYTYPEGEGRKELNAVTGKLKAIYDTHALEIQTKNGQPPLMVYSTGSPVVPDGSETDMNRYRGLVGKTITVKPKERGLDVAEIFRKPPSRDKGMER